MPSSNFVDNIHCASRICLGPKAKALVSRWKQICPLRINIFTLKAPAHNWRMSFNPDPRKQAVELMFSSKNVETEHPVILFNDLPVMKVDKHKHLGIILDSKLSFSAHIHAAITKSRKGLEC